MASTPAKQYQPQKDNALARTAAPPAPLAPVLETAAQAAAAQAKALVEAKFTIALHRPRDLDQVRAAVLKECERPSFAEVAIYRKPVGDDSIEGLSIRFVEAALQLMGNIDTVSHVIHDDPEKRVYGISVIDLERNVSYGQDVTIRKVVERSKIKADEVAISKRTNSKGYPVYLRAASDEEIQNTQNALISKVIRTQGARLIPGWLQAEAEAQIRATLHDRDKKDPDAQKRKLLDGFGAVGVSVDQVKEYLGRPNLDPLTPAELQELRAIYTAVKDGEASWAEVMDAKAEVISQGAVPTPPPPPAAPPVQAPAPAPAAAATSPQPAPNPTPQPTPAAPPPPPAKPEESLDQRRRKGVQAVKDRISKLGAAPKASDRPVAGDAPPAAPPVGSPLPKAPVGVQQTPPASAQPSMPTSATPPKTGRVFHTTDPDGNPVEIPIADYEDEDEQP